MTTTSGHVLLLPKISSTQIPDKHNERYAFVLSRTANKIVVRDYGYERVFHLGEDKQFHCAELPDVSLVMK